MTYPDTNLATSMLYRPVGLHELALIYDLEMRAFPPRLPDQPIFYPVLDRDYAIQIARDWNSPSEQSGYCGYVLQFEVDADYLGRFDVQTVGGRNCKELWVPAEQLDEFNRHICGTLCITDAFFGANYIGFVPDNSTLVGKNAVDQFVCIVKALESSDRYFARETGAFPKSIYLNFPFWQQYDFSSHGISAEQKQPALNAIAKHCRSR